MSAWAWRKTPAASGESASTLNQIRVSLGSYLLPQRLDKLHMAPGTDTRCCFLQFISRSLDTPVQMDYFSWFLHWVLFCDWGLEGSWDCYKPNWFSQISERDKGMCLPLQSRFYVGSQRFSYCMSENIIWVFYIYVRSGACIERQYWWNVSVLLETTQSYNL